MGKAQHSISPGPAASWPAWGPGARQDSAVIEVMGQVLNISAANDKS